MAGSAVLWSSATAIAADAARIAEEKASLVERWRDLGGELWIAAGVTAVALLAHVKDLETVGAAPGGEPGGPDDPELAMDAAANAELAAALYRGHDCPLPAPPLPDEATISQAAQLPLQQDRQAAAHPLAVDGGSASFQGPSGAHIQVAWTNPVAIAGFSHIPKFLYRRLDGLGDEAYRSRFGGYVAVRQSGHTAVVMTKLPGRSDDERDRVGLAVARVMVATAAQAGGAVGTPNGPLPDEASPDATPGTDHTGKVFGQW